MLSRIIRGFKFSLQGLSYAFGNDKSFRINAILSFLSIVVSLIWLPSPIIILSSFLLAICELINTAIEACIDRISTEQHPLSKVAKDVASAAVFLALINLAFMWLFAIFA